MKQVIIVLMCIASFFMGAMDEPNGNLNKFPHDKFDTPEKCFMATIANLENDLEKLKNAHQKDALEKKISGLKQQFQAMQNGYKKPESATRAPSQKLASNPYMRIYNLSEMHDAFAMLAIQPKNSNSTAHQSWYFE